MNMQIPSGLQALMQASQILQQQAAPTAPGPQGQQPTVASQVQQAAAQQAQQAQPSMQQIGQQAGIAGQLMAQRAQQAQNPQAVAQMAAQMLQQQGVAGLPSNMQFREGGIIGYNGEGDSDVDGPDEPLGAAKRRRIRAERERLAAMGSPFDRTFGMNPTELEDYYAGQAMAESEYEKGGPREAAAAREAVQAAMNRDRLRRARQTAGIAASVDPATLAGMPGAAADVATDVARPFVTAGRNFAQTVADAGSAVGRAISESAPGVAAGSVFRERGEDQAGVQSLAPGAGKTPIQPIVNEKDVPRNTSAAPPPAERPPERAPAPVAAPSGGIAAALKPVAAAAVPTPAYPTATIPQEVRGMMSEVRAAGENLLKAKQAQADLESEGIAALRRSENERKRLLESKRSRDSFNSLMALADSLYTRGNQYQAYKASVEARDEADRLASLAHDEAVIKLKQAKQAREMGNLELERNLKVDALTRFNEANKNAEDAAGKQATFASSVYSTQSHAAEQMANRANQINIELARMATEAERKKDADEIKRIEHLRARLNALTTALPRAQDQIASALKKLPEFKAVESLASRLAMGLDLDAKQQALLDKFAVAKQSAEKAQLEPIQSQIRQINKELGIEVPEITTSNLGAGFLDRINAELAARGKGKQ